MKKLLIIALVLVAVVFVAGCEEAADQDVAPAGDGAEPSDGIVDDISAAIASGSAYRCDSVQTQGGETYAFTWWVKGENMRGDWSYAEQSWHQIIKGDQAWMWDDTGNGFTMQVEAAEAEEPESYGMYSVENLENDYQGQWTCTPTVVGNERFEVPSNVQFMDLEQMMQQYQ